MNKTAVIGVIGGGLIGLATGLKIARLGLAKKIIVLEKESTVCSHQSGRNSGVLHCGLYYKPGSLKAKLAVGGLAEMVDFCRDHSIAYDICGKVVVATNIIEEKRLLSLQERGFSNGLDGLSILDPQEIARIEPHVRGTMALHVPQEGIVDYAAVGRALVALLQDAGNEIRTNHCVTSITPTPTGVRVGTDQETFEFSHIINCAGLHSDRIYRLSGHRAHSTIIPFRGEYFSLSSKGTRLVNNLIYPVPDPDFPFLGVHFTRMIGGGVLAGPNAALVLHREGYSRFSISLRDAI